MSFSAAGEASYVDEGDGLLGIGVQVTVELDDSLSRGVSGAGVR